MTQTVSETVKCITALGEKYQGKQVGAYFAKLYNDLVIVTGRKLPRGYAVKSDDPWCAIFVSDIIMMLGWLYPIECSAHRLYEKMMEDEKEEVSFEEARPLDFVFYDWGTDGWFDHVGICVRTWQDEKGVKRLEVLEGNVNKSITFRTINQKSKNLNCKIVS